MPCERCGAPASIDECPTFRHRHRVGMASTNVVLRRMGFVSENVEEHGLIGVVVVKRGGCRSATPRSSARTSHELTLSPAAVRRRDRRPVASPPWRSPRRTQRIRRVRIDQFPRRGRTGPRAASALRKVACPWRRSLRSAQGECLRRERHPQRPQRRALPKAIAKHLVMETRRAGDRPKRRPQRRSTPTALVLSSSSSSERNSSLR